MRHSVFAAVLAASLLGLALASASIASPSQQFQPTCRAGRTLFRDGPVRAFHVSFYDRADKGDHQEILACIPGPGKPVVLYDPGPFNYVQASDFHIIGHRLGFVAYDQGFANGSEVDVGWLDLWTRDVRFGLLNAGVNAGPHDPLLPDNPIDYAIAADGTTAVLAGRACQVVAILRVRRKLLEHFYGLGPPLVIFTAANGGLKPTSIQINAETVTWQTVTGTPGSAPLSANPPEAPSPTGGC
ncbi:MAG: hypothetical protein ABSG64_03005 [Solirubrobacteraceae bacterium]